MNDAPEVADLLDLSGRTVLVTGASGNIGAGIALRLAEAGAEVVAHYRRERRSAVELAGRIGNLGSRCTTVQADLSEPSAIAAMFDALHGDGTEIDLVVNNAATQPVSAFEDLSVDDWRSMMAANLDSAFMIMQIASARLRERGSGGAIVNIGSIEGSDPAPGHSHYATSKAGLAMLTRAAALELGRHGVRVNCVSPGLIDREGLDADWPDGVQRWCNKAPLSRLGRASDVADAVLFLLSPAARWISGANLLVDGGMSTVSRW